MPKSTKPVKKILPKKPRAKIKKKTELPQYGSQIGYSKHEDEY